MFDAINSLLGTPLGWVMWLCHKLVNNYGIALFLFTLIMRLIMIPLTIKQQKSSAKMTLIQPKMQELQKKYANNREKLTEEMNALYQKEGYSPTSGCLPMLIQFPILFGLIDVIYKPLKHILHLPTETIAKIVEMANAIDASHPNTAQIRAIQYIRENTANWVQIGQENIDQILSIDMNFFGLNLGLQPSTDMIKRIFIDGFNPLLLIPLISGLTALAMSLISMKTASASAGGNPAANSMKGMFLMMPIFSFMIPFSMPAGVGLYWTYSNVIGIVQSLLMNKFYNPKELAEKAKAEREEREERERRERIEAKKLAREKAKAEGKEYLDESALSQKELNRRKLAEARKRDAEKYGEEYVEVTDEDIN